MSQSDIALEATGIIQKFYRHILVDNCDHCRAVLNNNTAGKHPAAKSQPDCTPTYSNTTQNRMSISTP